MTAAEGMVRFYSDNPTSPYLSLLLCLVPGCFFFARYIASRSFSNQLAGGLAIPAIILVLLLCSIDLIGMAVHRFTLSVCLSFLFWGGLGYWTHYRMPKQPLQPTDWRPLRGLVYAAILCTLFIIPTTFAIDIWDHGGVDGQYAIINKILNGTFPPNDFTFADLKLTYHYGFALFSAIVTSVTRLPAVIVVRIILLSGWCYSLILLGYFANRILVRPLGILALLLVALGGGLPWFTGQNNILAHTLSSPWHFPSKETASEIYTWLWNYCWPNPPFISYFYQNSWSIGVPIFGMLLLLLLELQNSAERTPRWRYGLLFFCQVSFAICNTTLFIALSGAIGLWCVSEILFRYRSTPDCNRRQSFLHHTKIIGILLLAFIVGLGVNGLQPLIINSIATGEGNKVVFYPFAISHGNPLLYTLWLIATLGFLLWLGLLGLTRQILFKNFLLCLLFLTLIICTFFSFTANNNINKFLVITQMVLALGVTSYLADIWAQSSLSSLRKRVNTALVLALCLPCGFIFEAVYWTPENWHIMADAFKQPHLPPPDAIKSIFWLRRHIAARTAVICPVNIGIECGLSGGLTQLMPTDLALQSGLEVQRMQKRLAVYAHPTLDIDYYLQEQVHWAIIPADSPRWGAIVARWQRTGHATEVYRYGGARVYYLT